MQVQSGGLDKDGDRGKSRDAHHKEESTGLVADYIERQEQGSNEEGYGAVVEGWANNDH